jgi:hypothetical protein
LHQLGNGEYRPEHDGKEIRADLDQLMLVDPPWPGIQVSSHAGISSAAEEVTVRNGGEPREGECRAIFEKSRPVYIG